MRHETERVKPVGFHRGERLGPKEREVLVLVRDLTEREGHPPSVPEVAAALPSVQRTTLYERVSSLRRKGMLALAKPAGRARRAVVILTPLGQRLSGAARGGDSVVRPSTALQEVITMTEPSAPEPETAPEEEWSDEGAETLISGAWVRFRGVQHPSVEGQMKRLAFWREFGRLRKARDLPALRRVLAEFEAWMEIESADAATFWVRERERLATRERRFILSGALFPEGAVVGGLDYGRGYIDSGGDE